MRLEKVESDMNIKKYVIRKEVKSTNEEETRNKIIMISDMHTEIKTLDLSQYMYGTIFVTMVILMSLFPR